MSKPKAIICDLDGTLCDHRHRLHFVDASEYLYKETVERSKTANIFQVPPFKPDYESFYAAMDKDGVNEWCLSLLHAYIGEENWTLHLLEKESRRLEMNFIFITGRPERYREKTEKWLQKLDFSPQDLGCIDCKLFMRPDFIELERWTNKASNNVCMGKIKRPDNRPSAEVKREIYLKEIQGKYDVIFVLEDSIECAEMYKSLGLTVLRVMG